MRLVATIFLCAILFALAPQPSFAQEHDKDSIGLTLGKNPSAKDIGLPVYPGSKPHHEESNDSAAKFGLWGGGSGFKLSVLKMDTPDAPDKVAAFYKKALAKYGKDLDCTNSQSQSDRRRTDDENSKALACDDDKPDANGMLFKAGTKNKQHIVSIAPNGKDTLYKLASVSIWDSDKKNHDAK